MFRTTFLLIAFLFLIGTAQGADKGFVEFQSIATNGAIDWEFFTIGSDYYLAVANYHNGSTYDIDSKIYTWDGASFLEFQTIPTTGAYDWQFFTIGSDHYLAVGQAYSNGFAVGFFLSFFLIILAVAISAWFDRRRGKERAAASTEPGRFPAAPPLPR